MSSMNTMAMPMQQVRVHRAPQVPVPPVPDTPLEISRETRRQLRVTRQRAFERHQENAQWTAELLGDVTPQEASATSSNEEASAEQLNRRIAAKNQQVAELERQMTQDRETHETAQQKFEDILSALKSATDAEALKRCEEQLQAQKATLLPTKQRKMEIVRL